MQAQIDAGALARVEASTGANALAYAEAMTLTVQVAPPHEQCAAISASSSS
jgi:hypothetical protein